MSCPRECEEDREKMNTAIDKLYDMSIPSWVRGLLIGGIVGLFVLYGGLWIYTASTFATKTELKEVKNDVKEMRKEISKGFSQVLRKLEK